MPTPEDRRKLQSLYPEPKARSGMDARKPTTFHIPVVKLSLLLFFPVFFITALYSIQFYGNLKDWNAYAINFIGIFCFVMIAIIASMLMLLYARSIVVRNSNRSWIVGLVYIFLVIPLGCVLLFKAKELFGDVLLWHLFAYEAALLYVASLVPSVIARQLSR